ncbi:MAG: PAS domain S-box protein [Deltaproteobacteria bacterium]|nr:PAS domain S-box protein [Deltaproteobacteria bacterium]
MTEKVQQNALQNTAEGVAFLRHEQEKKILSIVGAVTSSEEAFRAFLDSSTEAIVLADDRLNLVALNQAALRLMAPHSSIQKVVGKNIVDLVPGIRESGRFAAYRRVIETGVPFMADDVIPHPSFGELYLSVRAFRVGIGMGLIVSDFTKQKRAEKERRLSESRFRRLYDSNLLAVAFWNADDTLHDANSLFGQIIGTPVDDLKAAGMTHESMTQPKYFPVDKLARQHIAQNGVCLPYEKEFVRQDGTSAPVIIGGGALDSTDGGYVTYMIDITERRKSEELLLRTEKLESLSLLAGGIAHDFNNLLSGIFGYMDLALQVSPSDSDAAHFLNLALRTIERARGITQQLLTFAKGGAPNRKPGSLFPMVEETVRFCLSGSNVACEFNVADDLYQCDFDKTQMGQVIENITINAQHAMPNGGILRVSAQNCAHVPEALLYSGIGDWVELSISDTGIGIPENILPRIFDPFFTTKHRGSGLGLATCHSIVRRHGGSIDATSSPGQGTSFRIFLPANATPLDELASKEETIHQGTGEIVLMDDQMVVLDAFTYMLRSFGYLATRTGDGDEALEHLVNAKKNGLMPKAMILDLTVPGKKGGLDIIKAIRQIDAALPVFVTSGYNNDPIMANPTSYGFTDQIPKPFTLDELSTVLNRHLH